MENEDKTTQYELYDNAVPAGVIESASSPPKKRKPWYVVKIVLVIFALTIVIGGIYIYNEYRNYEYLQQLATAADTMMAGAAKLEECGILIGSTWHNAIFKQSDPQTDKFTKPNGYFVSDFNEALTALSEDEEFQNKIEEIRDYQDEINSLMGKIKNPPSKYEALYTQTQNLYDDYMELNMLVLLCNGSCKSFSEDFDTIRSNIIKDYHKLQQYFS